MSMGASLRRKAVVWMAQGLLAAATAAAVVVAPVNAAQSGGQGRPCTAADGQAGVCKIIGDCPPMLALLSGRPSQENLNLLSRNRCGFQGSIPVVCCAEEQKPPPPPPPPPPTPTPSPSPSPSPPGTDTAFRETPEDVSTHPNLNLLPQDYCSPDGASRIVGGKAADVFAYPWIARLGYRSRRSPWRPVSYRCGGSLVSARYVLTAAHCIKTRTELHLVTVKLGEHTIDKEIDCRTNNTGCIPPPIDVDVEQTIVHPGYNDQREGNYHDIALARLARNIDLLAEEFVRPVCLPASVENQLLRLDGIKLVVAGWGLTEEGEGSKVLKDVLVPVMPLKNCQAVYKQAGLDRDIVPQQLCAGGVAGQDSCNGDSGGPLMHETTVNDEPKTVLFGIVSFGHSTCGTQGVPGVYTRVAFYMKWILDTMKP